MPRHAHLLLVPAFVGLVALAACDGNEYRSTARDSIGPGPAESDTAPHPQAEGHADPDRQPPSQPAGPADDEDRDARVENGVAHFLGLAMDVPEGWTLHAPSNAMRAAEFTVPAETGDAEVIVFHFPGSGGSTEANIDRWRQQFRPVDGQLPEPTITEFESDGMPITLVELRGDHQPMLAETYNEDNILLSAIIDAPVGRTFIQFMGPRGTVGPRADDFEEMLRGMRLSG